MPIIGLTDRTGQGFERIAKLYKGSEKQTRKDKKTGEEYKIFGKDLEHFRIEFEPQFEHLRELWEAMYEAEPIEFENVYMTARSTDEAFQAWKEEWNASATLIHRCDGEQQVRWYNADAGIHMSAKVACVHDTEKSCDCKETGRLDLVFPDFCAEAGVLGIITLTTHSVFDIMTIHKRLKMVESITGDLSSVPFVIGRAPREINVPGKDKNGKPTRMKTTKSLIYINPTQEVTRGRLIPMLAQPKAPAVALLATGTDGAIIEEATDRIKTLLGTGDAPRRMGTAEPELAIVEPVDLFANLRAKLEEVELSITKIEERQIPGTYEIVLNRAVTDVEAFKVWLIGHFGEQIRHVYAESFDFQLAAPPTAQGG